MFKLFRHSNAVLRLCEFKHFGNKVFNQISSNVVSEFNLILANTNLCRKYCSTQQQKESNLENSERSEHLDSIMKDVINGDPELDTKLKVIALEAEVMRQEGANVPSDLYMKKDHWVELLKLQTRSARRRYLNFLFKLEKIKENYAIKREQKRLEREAQPKLPVVAENGHLVYSLTNNNIFLRFYDTTINHFYNSKLVEAMMFGQQLVVDCGYDKDMTKRENVNCAKQLTFLFSDNRNHDDPFDLHFCNMERDSPLAAAFYKHVPTMYEPWFPLNIHTKSYCDIFPKQKLIYLTPHCKEEMLEYDHDAVYIIGAIVDKTNHDPLSLAKAKKEGLKMLKFPFDRYLSWGAGSGKNLTLNQVISILLDMKKTGNWNYALRHVPKRKIVNEHFSSNTNNNYTRPQQFNRNSYTHNTRPRNFDQTADRKSSNSRSTKFRSIKSILFDD